MCILREEGPLCWLPASHFPSLWQWIWGEEVPGGVVPGWWYLCAWPRLLASLPIAEGCLLLAVSRLCRLLSWLGLWVGLVRLLLIGLLVGLLVRVLCWWCGVRRLGWLLGWLLVRRILLLWWWHWGRLLVEEWDCGDAGLCHDMLHVGCCWGGVGADVGGCGGGRWQRLHH